MAARPRSPLKRKLPQNLYKNKKGYFSYRNPATGKTYGLGYDEGAAIDDARAANAELARQKSTLGLVERINGQDMSVAKWCDRYDEIYAKRSENKASITTMKSITKRIRLAPFAKTAVKLLQPREINEWLQGLETEVSDTYSSDMRYRLTGFFNDAISEGLLDAGKNPVAALRSGRATVKRDRLTLDTFKAILAKAKESPRDRWAYRAFLLALLTGQRREDIGEMRFADIKGGFLYVEQRKSQGDTKLKIPTSIGLTVMGLTIEDVIRECRDAILSPWVIHHVTHTGKTKPGDKIHKNTLSGGFAVLRDAAKIKPDEGRTPPTFHEIRSLSARLYSEQYGPDFAQALLGHKSAEMTALYRDSRGKEWKEIKVGSA
jgi:integrase